MCDLVYEKQSRWKLILFRCKINFSQKPFRVRDLNAITIRKELIEKIKKVYPDNFLFRTSDEMLLASPDETFISEIKKLSDKYGFWLEVIKATSNLNGLKPDPLQIKGNKLSSEYPQLLDEITPPICEIC